MSQMKAQVDKLLTDVSQGIFPTGHISEALAPFIKVSQSSGKLGKYGNSHLRIELSLSGGRGKYRRVEPIVRETQSYLIESHGLEGMVTKDDYRNVEKPFDAEKHETAGLVTHLWLEKEKVLADALSNVSVITQNTTLSGTSQFSDYANSDPLDKFKTARAAVRSGSGAVPDTAWMDWATADVLRYHPQLLDALGFKEARPGGLGDQELAKAMGVKRVMIAEPVYNSAAEGQTAVLAPVWGKHVWFGVLPVSAQVRQVSLLYRLGFESAGRKTYKEALFNPPGATSILVEDEYQFLIANAGAGYLIKDAVA